MNDPLHIDRIQRAMLLALDFDWSCQRFCPSPSPSRRNQTNFVFSVHALKRVIMPNAPMTPSHDAPTWLKVQGVSARTINLVIGGIALLIGPGLMLIGYLTNGVGTPKHHGIEDSISAYYHYNDITRNLFVGLLSCIGFLTLCYRGWNVRVKWIDRLIGGTGCIAAMLVANVPCCNGGHSWVHNLAAGVFIVLLAVMLLTRFTEKSGDPDEVAYPIWKSIRNRVFQICGCLMLFSLLPAAASFFMKLSLLGDRAVLVTELGALTFFGLGWLTKSRFAFGYRRDELGTMQRTAAREKWLARVLMASDQPTRP